MTTALTPAFDVSVETPGLVVDLDRAAANVSRLAEAAHAAGATYFPHAKSHRSPELGRLQLDHGADGLCLAKIGEAERFADALADIADLHIIVAFPITGTEKAERALALSERITLTLGTDSVAGAATISEVFAAAGKRCRLFLAVDAGLHREGVAPADAAAVAREIAALPGVHLDGVYTHEGHVMQSADRDALVRNSIEAAEVMVQAAEDIRAAGVPITDVSTGCSGSAIHQLGAVAGITQVRPGINTFNDVGQLALGNATLDTIAERVHVTVASHPEPGRACIDAGTKSIGNDQLPAKSFSERYPGFGLLVNAPGWQVTKLSEEHGQLRWIGDGPTPELPVGTRLELIPNHVCVSFGSLRKWTAVRGGEIVGVYDCLTPGSSE